MFAWLMNQISILLIEDDPDDVELMEVALKGVDVDYTMKTISQGDTVIPYLETCRNFPNVIILDLNIPKLHGREVLHLIKKSERFKNIPLAILTTASSQKEKDQCLQLGANIFLTKPSTVEGFNQTIKAIVEITASSRN
jgi:CheY-like chemotaxis protein